MSSQYDSPQTNTHSYSDRSSGSITFCSKRVDNTIKIVGRPYLLHESLKVSSNSEELTATFSK